MTEYIITRTDLSAIQRTKIDLYGGSELLRCKDCKHWYDEACFVDSHSREEADRIILDRFEMDFCSRAERKEE